MRYLFALLFSLIAVHVQAETVTLKTNPNISIVFEDSVPETTRRDIIYAADLAQAYFWENTQTKIQHKLKIVAYNTNGFARRNIPKKNRNAKCDGGYASGINGVISEYAVICLSSNVFKRAAKSGPEKLAERVRELTVHELAHVYQSIWSNGTFNVRGQPHWMPESDANYVAQQLRYVPQRSETAMLEKWMKDANTSVPINRIKSRSDFDRYIPASYSNTALAKRWLVNRFGIESTMTYWTELGRTKSFDAAFQRAYGMSPGIFYQQFGYGE